MEIKLNLASKPYLNRQAIRLWLLLICALMALLLAFNTLYGFQNFREMRVLDERSLELEEQLAGLPGGEAGYTPEKFDIVREEVALAREIVAADQFHWTHLLGRLEDLVPDDVSLRAITPNFKEHSVQIRGVARNVSAMTHFIDNLLDSEDLNQAYLQSQSEVESNPGLMPQLQTEFSLMIRGAF